MANYLALLDTIRTTETGDPQKTYRAARTAGLPELVAEYLALENIWKSCPQAFWDLCERISKDTGLLPLYKAAALVSLGDTHRRTHEKDLRLGYYRQAMRVISSLGCSKEEFKYIKDRCDAGQAQAATAIQPSPVA